MTSHRQTRHLEYGWWLLISMFLHLLISCKSQKNRLRVSSLIYSSSITQSEALWVWRCDVTTSNSIQDGGALVVNTLVFDLRVQLQHCTYQRKTLLFSLIKVSTFICKREISGLSSPLTYLYQTYFTIKVNKLLRWLMKMCVSKNMWKLERCISDKAW